MKELFDEELIIDPLSEFVLLIIGTETIFETKFKLLHELLDENIVFMFGTSMET